MPTTNSKRASYPAFVILFLIFAAIIPLASADAWNEAIVLTVVFGLFAIVHFRESLHVADDNFRRLITPVIALAAYSFFQGLSSIVFEIGNFIPPWFVPGSYDPAASVWSAFKFLSFALLLILISSSFKYRLKLLTWGLILIGNVYAVFGIVRFLLQESFPEMFSWILSQQLAPGVGFGTYLNQNHFAYLMLMVFGLNISLFWRTSQSKGMRLLLLFASAITWAAVVLTGSRGGIISSFVEIAVLLLMPLVTAPRRERGEHKGYLQSRVFFSVRQIIVLALIFGTLIVGIVLIGQERVVERIEDIPEQFVGVTDASTFRRTDAWLATLTMTRENPVFGVGFGGFQFAVSQFIDISGQIAPKQAHNDYLEFAASGGLIGVSLGLWFLFRFFSLARKRLLEPSTPFTATARIGALCGIAGVATHSFFDFGLQIVGNQLFFCALIYIAVHNSQPISKLKEYSSERATGLLRYASSGLLIVPACLAAFFGLAEYERGNAYVSRSANFVENGFFNIPFDADYYETRAAVYANLGNSGAAVNELRTAIKYRESDYSLWLRLAKLEEVQKHISEADDAFRRAMELAPRYGEPHFHYGKFLIEVDRADEGLTELRLAAFRNPAYFDEALGLIWKEKGGDAGVVIAFLKPMSENELRAFAEFLLKAEYFEALSQLGCSTEPLDDELRDSLVKRLLEKKRYHFADQIHRKSCRNAISGEVENGSTDSSRVKRGVGFGWRFQSPSDNTRVSYDAGFDSTKGKSLRLDFNGQDDSFALISQIVVVERRRRYKLSFAYKSRELITGGLPVLQVILKQPDGENIAGDVKLALKETGWVQSSIDFATGENTEVIEIRLTREGCGESLCPIFGSLWLDKFSLRKLD